MPFTIQSDDLAEAPAIQSIWYDVDVAIIAAAMSGVGVLTNCNVTAQGSPDMTVAVAAGTIQPSAGAAAVTVSAGNVSITAASGSFPRLDLVTASAAGVKTVTDGTAAASPKPPALPSGHIALAMIYVPTSATTITTARITSKRFVIPAFRVRNLPIVNRLSGGDVTITATTNVVGSGITGLGDITLAAITGDWIEVSVNASCQNTTANSMKMDVITVVSAAAVNWFSSGSSSAWTNGVMAWYMTSAVIAKAGGSVFYQVQAGDLSGGNVVLRLLAFVSGSRVLSATTTNGLSFSARNLGQ